MRRSSRLREPCAWCVSAATRGDVTRPVTHLVKWPDIDDIPWPWRRMWYRVCQKHAAWPFQPRGTKAYKFRSL